MSDWSSTEGKAFYAVQHAGALTARRLDELCGLRPNWSRLLTVGWLKQVKTVYGPVVTWGDRAHDLFGTHAAARLSAPSSLADRAYMMDALRTLELEGYTVVETEFKSTPQLGKRGAHIVRARVQVSEVEMQALRAFRQNSSGGDPAKREKLGQPWVYARISGGGINRAMASKLYHGHAGDINLWRSPLILVVPSTETFRGLLRAQEAERARNQVPQTDAGQIHSALRLVTQPRPNLIQRPSNAP